MKKWKIEWHIFAVTLLLAILNVLPVSASEEIGQKQETGSISLILKNLEAENSATEGVEFCLWKVGTVNEHGTPVIDENYGIPEYPQDSQSLDEAAEKIADMVLTESGQPDRIGITNQTGQVIFEEVQTGVYLICAEEDNPYGRIAPFLVQLPYWEEVEGQMEGPIYEVVSEPKASPYPEEEPEEPAPDKETSVQTGDDTQTGVRALIPAGAAVVAGAILFMRRRRKEEGADE